jgi:hypothetical protein
MLSLLPTLKGSKKIASKETSGDEQICEIHSGTNATFLGYLRNTELRHLGGQVVFVHDTVSPEEPHHSPQRWFIWSCPDGLCDRSRPYSECLCLCAQ